MGKIMRKEEKGGRVFLLPLLAFTPLQVGSFRPEAESLREMKEDIASMAV
jgi:hypothetical protein